MSAVKLRRAKPRLHSLYQSIREANAVGSCAGSAVASGDGAASVLVQRRPRSELLMVS